MNKVLLLTMIVLTACQPGCKNKSSNADPKRPNLVYTEDQYRTGDDLWYVCYGTTGGPNQELMFVFFEKGALDNPPGIRRVVSNTVSRQVGAKTIIDRRDSWLIDSYGGDKMIQLPTDTQLYEVQDSKLLTRNERVTLDQLKRFIDSKPQNYTLDHLLSFIASPS